MGSCTAVEPGLRLGALTTRRPATELNLRGLPWGLPTQERTWSFCQGNLRDKCCRSMPSLGAISLGSKDFTFEAKILGQPVFPKVSIKSFQDCWFWGNLDGMPPASVVLASEKFHQTVNQLGNLCEHGKYFGFHKLSFSIRIHKKTPFA